MSRHLLNVIDKMNDTPLIFDGAMGTAIYEKGVFINAVRIDRTEYYGVILESFWDRNGQCPETRSGCQFRSVFQWSRLDFGERSSAFAYQTGMEQFDVYCFALLRSFGHAEFSSAPADVDRNAERSERDYLWNRSERSHFPVYDGDPLF